MFRISVVNSAYFVRGKGDIYFNPLFRILLTDSFISDTYNVILLFL
jgi:hypothetical protein